MCTTNTILEFHIHTLKSTKWADMNMLLENTNINILILKRKIKQLSQLQKKKNVSELKLKTKTQY